MRGFPRGGRETSQPCLCTGHLGLKCGPYLPMLGKLRAGTPFCRLPGGRRRISRQQHPALGAEVPSRAQSVRLWLWESRSFHLRAMHVLASHFQLREEEDNQKRAEHRGRHLLGFSCIASPVGRAPPTLEATISFIFPALFHLSGCERS